MSARLTPARLRALLVLAAHDGTARESNSTSIESGLIYWQSLDWLLSEGYAEAVPASIPCQYRITSRGAGLMTEIGQ